MLTPNARHPPAHHGCSHRCNDAHTRASILHQQEEGNPPEGAQVALVIGTHWNSLQRQHCIGKVRLRAAGKPGWSGSAFQHDPRAPRARLASCAPASGNQSWRLRGTGGSVSAAHAGWRLPAHQPGCVGRGRVRRPAALRQLGHAAVGVSL